LNVVRWHHERYDGSGVPDGLTGEGIPLEARIAAVADSLDAMTSGRPYRPGRTLEAALDELERCSGSQFDPAVVEAANAAAAAGELAVIAELTTSSVTI
jgi:putative two-component system response regulator